MTPHLSPLGVLGVLALLAAAIVGALALIYGPLYGSGRDARADLGHGNRHEPDGDLPEPREVMSDAG